MDQNSVLFVTLSAIPVFASGAPEVPPDNRPNIIFILTDDHRWDAAGYAGNRIIHTPNIDRLAGEGTWFSHAFVTTPISAASRASILTGMYERTHGYTFEQGPLKEQYRKYCYPLYLRENGYHTGFFGKLGVTCRDDAGMFDEADIYDRNVKYPDRRGYFFKTIGKDTVHLTRYTGYKAQEFIRNAPAGKPFCLSLSFSAPHAHDNAPEQYIWQEKSSHLYEDVIFPPPPLSEEKYFLALPEEVRKGYNRLRWTWRFDTPEKYQHSLKGYYRMISEVDYEIGEIIKLLDEKGISGNTVIIFTGDNGYYLGERQLADKWLMHDNSLRVPLIIYHPGAGMNNKTDDMVLNIDIPATILDIAGIKAPAEYQGISLMPYVRKGKPEEHRDYLLFEHLWELVNIPSSEGIRSEKWKYFRYRLIDAPEELYDIEHDPLETVNLASDPAYSKVIDNLRSECNSQIDKYTRARIVDREH